MTESDGSELLDEARTLLERAYAEAPLTQGERSYLAATAVRLDAMASQLRGGRPAGPEARNANPTQEEAPDMPARPRRLLTRKEAAAVIGCAPNTLLNWESRGLLQTRRDARGWRVYDREALARAMALAAHVPLADAPGR